MPPRAYTRVAVAQLACLPAISLPDRAPFEDPLFDMARADALRPEGEPPPELDERFRALRERIARAHFDQLLLKVTAILEQCQRWGVRLIVFPEYSLPWQILEDVARAGGELVIVAGTHSVTRDALRSGVYGRLGATPPRLGEAVCPVLHRGRLLGLQPKLSPAVPEQGSLKPGRDWFTVPLPDGLPGPLGVLICLDFLYRESEAHRTQVGGKLESCRFLAVPSYTPLHSATEFINKAHEEARRYGRPVLWADVASFSDKVPAGGSSLYVDEGHPGDLRRFPEHAGYLEAGDEGVIVADVDLGFERVGSSTRYDWQRPIVPFAAANLVYRARPAGEALERWLARSAQFFEGPEDDFDQLELLAGHVTDARSLLLDAASSGTSHERRIRQLLREADKLTKLEQFRQYTREILLPPEALPLSTLNAVLAGAASDAIFDWQKNWRGFGLGELMQRLHEAARKVSPPDKGEWSEAGFTALVSLRRSVQGAPEAPSAEAPALQKVRLVVPAGLDPAALGELRHGELILRFRPRPEDFRTADPNGRPAFMSRPDGPSRFAEGSTFGFRPDDFVGSLEGVHATQGAVTKALDLFLLVTAQDLGRTAAVALGPAGAPASVILPVTRGEHDQWTLWVWDGDEGWASYSDDVRQAFEQLGSVQVQQVSRTSLAERLDELLPRFAKGQQQVEELLTQRLALVNDTFVEPRVRVGPKETGALTALDQWLDSGEQTALVLGDYGSGKSTTLAKWCANLWATPGAPRPLLCNLASAAATRDAEGLVLDAAGAEDTPANRAALRLLVRARRLLPCFDGFDEMATRIGADEMAARLSELLGVAADGGRVVVSSREHYFSTESTLRTTTTEALQRALGASAGLVRLRIQPFAPGEIRKLVRGVVHSEAKTKEVLERIRQTYDLMDLVTRPLLLGMVLQSLDRMDPQARVAPADVYDAYLQHWLSQTRQDEGSLSHEQKMQFTESLGEELWRSGEVSLTWQELRSSVRQRLGDTLPAHLPPEVIFRDIEGGAFFVREGEERYRFAHKSFLEYFLARSLLATLADQPGQALDTRPLTREVAAFVGELLRQRGTGREEPALQASHAFLRAGRGDGDRDADGFTRAAANAVRLLHGLAVWSQDGQRWIPEGADLRGVDLTGEDLRGARLGGARLGGASLSGADLSGADLSGAELSRVALVGARLDRAVLRGVTGEGADLTGTEAMACDATGAILADAVLAQAIWLDTGWEDAELSGATTTAAVLAPAPPAPSGRGHRLNRGPGNVNPLALQPVLATGHRSGINGVAWDAAGKRLASAGEDGTVRVWDGESGRELRALQGHNDIVWAVAWDAFGERLASGGLDGPIRVWDAESGRELRALQGHNHSVLAVAWDAGGKRLVSAGLDGTVRIWDVENGRELRVLQGHTDRVWTVAWDAGGEQLASAGDDSTVRVWEAESGRELRALQGHTASVLAVAWDAGGKRLASAGDDGTVRVWEAESGRELHSLQGHTASVWAVGWDASGKRLVSAGDDGTVRVWKAERGCELRALQGHNHSVRAVAWDASGKRLASAGVDGTVRVWNAESGRELRVLQGHTTRVWTVAWDAGGEQLASAGHDGTVRVWEAESGRELRALRGHTTRVWAVAWDAAGKWLTSAGEDGTVRVWEAESGRELRVLQGHTAGVRAVAWDAGGKRYASAGLDGIVRIWEAASGRELRALQGHNNIVRAVAWDADGKRLASAGEDGTVRVWEAESGRELRVLQGHNNIVWAVAWDAAGKRLASAGFDGTVRVWEAESGRELRAFTGHKSSVVAVAWDVAGKRLASAGFDGTVRVWEAESGRELRALEGHNASVVAVAWDAAGKRLASAGDDGVLLWNAATGQLLATLEAAGDSTLARTPAGHCVWGGDPSRHVLAASRPERPGTKLYLPLGGLRAIFEKPEKVKAALAGQPVDNSDLVAALSERGWAGGDSWDGEIHRLAAEVAAPTPTRVQAPQLPPNPFRPGPALRDTENLAGREAASRELIGLVEGRSPAVLIGPRRAGKTSLLAFIEQRLGPERSVRSLTLEGQRLQSADDLALLLEPELAEAAPRKGSRARPRRPSENVVRGIEKSPGRVYLLDEIAWLHEGDETLFPWLRMLGQRYASIVLAGSRWDWVRVVRRAAQVCPGSSFGNDVTEVVLGPIDEADARTFLTTTAPGVIDDKVAGWVVDLCGAWPFYLQVMGHALYAAADAGQRKAFNDKTALAELYDWRVLVERTAVFEGRFQELPEPVRALLRAHVDARPVFRDLRRDLRTLLVDTGLCTATGTWLPDRPFFDWIRRNAAHLSR